MLCELGNETELTTVFRLEHDGPFTAATARARRPRGAAARASGPIRCRPPRVLLGARLDAEHPGWDG